MQTTKNPIETHFHHFTRYHLFFFFFLFLTKVPIFWNVLSLIFLSPPMTYTCKGAVKPSTDQCPCKEPIWNRNVFTETMQTKYGIICDRKWLVSFSQSMMYVGLLLGAMSFGFLSDRFGRLSAFSLSCLATGVAGGLVRHMPTAGLFIFMRVIEGIGLGGSIVTSYVLCVEYCGIRYREMVSALFHVPINLGHMTLAGVSYLLRDCDDLQLAISLPMFLCAMIWYIGLESPKWLLDRGDTEKATAVMEKIQKFNRLPTDTIKTEMEAYHAAQSSNTHSNVKFWEIFRHRRLTINLLCMSVIYFVCGMGYYGVSQYIGKMSGDIHKNVAISGAMLLPGTITTAFLLQYLGRRTFLMATSFLSGTFMIIVIFIPEHASVIKVFFAGICNSFFFMSFIIVFLYGVELFPTSIRSSVLGILSTLSRLGQITAPPINALPQTVSGIIFGVMAIIGGFLCYPLPETKNIDLPSSLEDSKFSTPAPKVVRIEEPKNVS